MRVLRRNRQPFWYSLLLRKEDILSSEGVPTGRFKLIYDDPKMAYGNVSASSGSTINRATANVNQRQFGETVDYDRVIVCDDMTLPVEESTLIWYETETPVLQEDGTFNIPYNYIVTRVAHTLTVFSITLRQVTVNA